MAASRFALVSALLLGAGLTACSSSSETPVSVGSIPVVVQVDDAYVATYGRVWASPTHERDRVEDPSLLERGDWDEQVYVYNDDVWYGFPEGQPPANLPRIIEDEEGRWWIPAEEALISGSPEFSQRYFPGGERSLRSLDLYWCKVEKACAVTLRVRAEPLAPQSLREDLWATNPSGWYEADIVIPAPQDVSADEVVDYMSYPMHLVVTFDEEGAVAGFQSVGKDGAFLEGSVRALQKP